MDPIAQAHIGHRQGQVRKMMNEARVGRDPILMEKAQTLQQHMMPEQMSVQMGAMKPMMFTMIFIIAIFSWMGNTVKRFQSQLCFTTVVSRMGLKLASSYSSQHGLQFTSACLHHLEGLSTVISN